MEVSGVCTPGDLGKMNSCKVLNHIAKTFNESCKASKRFLETTNHQ